MGAHEELATVIGNFRDDWYKVKRMAPAAIDRDEAAAILAAGYRKLRTVTTIEELDALAEGSVIYLTEMTGAAEKFENVWVFIGNPTTVPSANTPLPAMVLYEPS